MKTKISILIFTDWFYPAFKAGGPVQSVVNMVELLKQEHEVYIFTADRDLYDAVPFSGLQPDQWLEQKGYTIQYHSPGKMTYKKVKSLIKEIDPDKIYLNSMFSNMILPIMAAFRSGKLILAPRGMLRPSALKVKPIRKYLYLSFLKMLGVENHICFHATSNEEIADIKNIFPHARQIRVAANLPVKVQEQLLPLTKSPGELKLMFVGRIHPIKNLLLLLEALDVLLRERRDVSGSPNVAEIASTTPTINVSNQQGKIDVGQLTNTSNKEGDIRSERAQTDTFNSCKLQFTIAATIDDKAYWEQCKQKIAGLENRLSIQLHLDCPHQKVTELLQAVHLFVLPTEGENFGHAIFEALAVGCPVLISDQTPWRNLASKKAGMDLPLKDVLSDPVPGNMSAFKSDRLSDRLSGSLGFANAIKTFADMDDQHWQDYRKGALALAAKYEQQLDPVGLYENLFQNSSANSNQNNTFP